MGVVGYLSYELFKKIIYYNCKMAEGGGFDEFYDENRPLLDGQDDYDDDTDIQMDEFPNETPIVNGGTGLSAAKTRLRNEVVHEFYKQVGHTLFIKYHNKFEYKNKVLYFIKDIERIKLSSDKESGKCLALSTLKKTRAV